jgi:hypothetical protein
MRFVVLLIFMGIAYIYFILKTVSGLQNKQFLVFHENNFHTAQSEVIYTVFDRRSIPENSCIENQPISSISAFGN